MIPAECTVGVKVRHRAGPIGTIISPGFFIESQHLMDSKYDFRVAVSIDGEKDTSWGVNFCSIVKPGVDKS